MKVNGLWTYGATLLFLLLWPALGTRAQLTISLPPQQGQPGDTLYFSGSLMNGGSSTLYLNGYSLSVDGDGLSTDDTPFFTGAPASLPGGGSYSGLFFTVATDPTVPEGDYSGILDLFGGTTSTDSSLLASQPFALSIDASPTPEPSPWAGLEIGGLGLAGLGLWVRKRKVTA